MEIIITFIGILLVIACICWIGILIQALKPTYIHKTEKYKIKTIEISPPDHNPWDAIVFYYRLDNPLKVHSIGIRDFSDNFEFVNDNN